MSYEAKEMIKVVLVIIALMIALPFKVLLDLAKKA